MVLAMILCASGLCHGEEREKARRWTVGADISEILYNRLSISFGRRISEKWSVDVTAGIDMKVFERNKSKEEEEHTSEFNQSSNITRIDYGSHKECVKFSYWPRSTFNGCCISMGIQHCETFGVDAIIAVGYVMPVWNGISISILYETGIKSSFLNGLPGSEALRIGVAYCF